MIGKQHGGVRKGAGRPRFEPTEKQRRKVRKLMAEGLTQERAATVMGISPPTLRRFFDIEIEDGTERALERALKEVYDAAWAGDVKSMRLYLRRKFGPRWREG